MKRTQLYLPEEDYEELREKAFRERTSVANLIREAIKEYTAHKRKKAKKKLCCLALVASGLSPTK